MAVEKLLLAAPRGYCAGVDRAVQTVERALELYGARGDFKVAMGEYPDGAGRLNLWDEHGDSVTGRVA